MGGPLGEEGIWPVSTRTAVHDHEDTPELREEIKQSMKDTEAAAV